jgi:hypothetical protein
MVGFPMRSCQSSVVTWLGTTLVADLVERFCRSYDELRRHFRPRVC